MLKEIHGPPVFNIRLSVTKYPGFDKKGKIATSFKGILVPRAYDPSGLCWDRELWLDPIFWEHAQSILFALSTNQICWTWREVRESRTSGVGPNKSSWSQPQARRIVGSEDENDLKGHSQLAHMRIRYNFIAYLHITETWSILFLTKYDKNNIIEWGKAHSKTGFSVNDGKSSKTTLRRLKRNSKYT